MVVGVTYGGIGNTPGAVTGTNFGGPVVEIKDSDGNFFTKIGIEIGSTGTQTTYKKFSALTAITGSGFTPVAGDIVSVTSSAAVVLKRGL